MQTRPWQKNYDYLVPTTIRFPRFPVQNLLHLAASQYPFKAATDFYGSEMSFTQLRTQTLRMANALVRLGVKKGDRVGLALPNCPQYLIAYYAILSAGAIVVNMNPLYTHDELKFMLDNTNVRVLITFDGALPTMRPLARELNTVLVVTRVTDYITGLGVSTAKGLDLEEGWHHFSELIEDCSDTQIPRIDLTPSDAALIQFTGGTTGLPKGALLTHGNVVAAALQCSLWGNSITSFVPYEKRNVLGILPYFHIYGNTCAMNWGMLNAATQVLVPRFDIDEVLGIIKRVDQITYFPTVPTMITAVVNHPKAEEMNLDQRFRFFNSGGAPMPAELIQKVKDLGIFYGEGWGMSETASLGISNPLLSCRTGAIGVPLMENDVRLVDVENGTQDVQPGQPGEILIKGPSVMKGYWNNPEETRLQLTDGWLHTGDIGQADEDGYIYIVDRKKDMIIAGGFNIYPREVDEVLYGHPKIAEAVTVGVPHEYRGETVKAFVVAKSGATLTAEEVTEFCRTKLAAYKVPKVVEFRESLPKSAVGKILRKILRDEEIARIKKR
ncbi:MAG: long-chain fatty acid--CoA ligase [Deltaproteobacteria bacterium]|nr:long-chain fatty acid--CoA ligase [Deltaproteobacteria bacterium]